MEQLVASLSFFDRENKLYTKQKPFYSNVPFSKTPDAKTTNIEGVQREVSLGNVRGFEDELSLDRNGFQLARHVTRFSSWLDGKKVVQEHYPEMEEYLRGWLDAREVVVYDHTLRSSSSSREPGEEVYLARPSKMAHVDITPEAVANDIRAEFGPRSEDILAGRYRVINIWRPLVEPVEQRPLALCDYRTARSDGVPTDLVFPHTVTEIITFAHSSEQRWYYVDSQMMDEIWLMKMMDSKAFTDPSIAKHTPHTSFENPAADPEGPPRRSIELRAYVFG